MKIGINTSFINLKSGIGTYVNNLVQNLQLIQNSSDEYHFYLSKESYDPEYFDEGKNRVYRYNIPQFNSLRKVLWEQVFLPGKVKKSKLDVFHSPAFISPLGLDIPSIVTIHDLAFLKYPDTIIKYKRGFYNYMFNRAIENSAKIITPSDFIKQELLESFECPEDKISVVYEGVSELFTPENDEEIISQCLTGLKIDKPFLMFTGIIEPRKNLENILMAFSKSGCDDMLFVIAGKEGWMCESVFEIIQESGLNDRVIITGEISPSVLRVLYSSCIALIFATLYEGFGLPVLEAMACGAPVVTSNRSALPEVAGDAALFVDPENVEEISDAMKRIIDDQGLRNELSQKGFDNIKRFSWKKCAEETSLIYHSL